MWFTPWSTRGCVMAWRKRGGASTVSDPAPSLTESPVQDKGLFVEAIDGSIIEGAGGTAAILSLHEADTGALKKRGFGPVFWISVVWVVGIILLAVFANFLPLPDPKATTAKPRLPMGTSGHILGTDPLGRDMLSR